ncbi:hypothetical protein BC830DRAFT_1171054 [Chytriomyces sp. MP71]|nr:hypothetical protein BC830DRAFT_1171054 [Chytriomyces sp. MP71]
MQDRCLPWKVSHQRYIPQHKGPSPSLLPTSTDAKRVEIHLIGQWYYPKSLHRTRELVRVLAINTNNSHIHKIHLIQPRAQHPRKIFRALSATRSQIARMFLPILSVDKHFPMSLFLSKLQLSFTDHSGRLLASESFRYASQNLKAIPSDSPTMKVAILANQDIYFDNTLHLIGSSPYSDLGPYTAYFLSRHEEPGPAENASSIGTQCGPRFVGSHDAFVFLPPLPGPLVDRCAFEMGSWGIEARLLWEFEQFGILGRNPCHDIKVWHVHMGAYKEDASGREVLQGVEGTGRSMPEVNVDGKSSIAFPDTLKTRFKNVVEERWGAKPELVE